MKPITQVINVYQEKYASGKYCTGIGDFIRGSLCLLQYATLQKIDFDMYYASHPISKFLCSENADTNSHALNPHIHPYRVFHYNSDDQQHTQSLQKIQKNFNEVILKNQNSIIDSGQGGKKKEKEERTFAIYTIAFPAKPISDEHKRRIRDALCPTPQLQMNIDKCMKEMCIVPKQYNVIHIRSGDRYLIHNNKLPFPQALVECKLAFLKLFNPTELTKGKYSQEVGENLPFVLISDNVELKKQLKRAIPNLIVNYNDIIHVGENSLNTEDDDDDTNGEKMVENTLIDFFIIAGANSVYAFSTMDHGTGFSEQCCQIHNVPYSSHRITID